jgi:hypothetical protein
VCFRATLIEQSSFFKLARDKTVNKKEPMMENLTLIMNVSQVCRLLPRHALPPSSLSPPVKNIDALPEIGINIRFPPLNFFFHGEQLAFLTELGLIMGNFGMVVANAAEEVSNDGKQLEKKVKGDTKDRSNTAEKAFDPSRPELLAVSLRLSILNIEVFNYD